MLYTYIKCSKTKTKNISGPSFLRKHPEQAATGASGLHYAILRSDRQGIWTKTFSMNADKNHKEKMGYDLGSCTQETIMMLNPSTFPSQGLGNLAAFTSQYFPVDLTHDWYSHLTLPCLGGDASCGHPVSGPLPYLACGRGNT